MRLLTVVGKTTAGAVAEGSRPAPFALRANTNAVYIVALLRHRDLSYGHRPRTNVGIFAAAFAAGAALPRPPSP